MLLKIKQSIPLVSGLALSLLSIQYALAEATCTVNGEEVPCDEAVEAAQVIGGVLLGILAVGALSGIFWLWMLISAIQNQNLDNKVVWIVLILLLGPLGAMIYFFVGRNKKPTEPTINAM